MNGKGLTLFTYRDITVRSFYYPEQYPNISGSVLWTISVLSAILLFVSVLLHEFSHSLVAQKFGIEINSIVLFIFGGVAQMRSEPEDPKSELYIAAAGPLCSLLLGILFLGLHALLKSITVEAFHAMLWYIGYLNLALVIFNMLPGFPLDGGRIARAAIWHYTDNLRKATKIVSNIGRGLAYLIIGIGILNILGGFIVQGLFFVFLGMFLQQAAIRGYQFVALREGLSHITVSDIMTPNPYTVTSDITLHELVDHYFYRYKVHSFPVTKEGKIVGFISIKHVKSIPQKQWDAISVGQTMDSLDQLKTLSPTDDAFNVLRLMTDHDNGRLPVVENGKVVGILTRRDIMEFVSMREEIGSI